MEGLTHVTIDFETSHLVFPTVIGTVLALLGLAIIIRRHRSILTVGGYWSDVLAKMDKMRFLGSIALTAIYFALLEPVGELWPNTGFGFLACSIPFVFLTGFLLMHHRTARSVTPVIVMALAAPVLTWWIFTDIFYLTLP